MYYSAFFPLTSHTMNPFYTFNLTTFIWLLLKFHRYFFLVRIPNTVCVAPLAVMHHLSFKLPPKDIFLLCDVPMGAEDLDS